MEWKTFRVMTDSTEITAIDAGGIERKEEESREGKEGEEGREKGMERGRQRRRGGKVREGRWGHYWSKCLKLEGTSFNNKT